MQGGGGDDALVAALHRRRSSARNRQQRRLHSGAAATRRRRPPPPPDPSSPPAAALRKMAEGVSLLRITPSQCLMRGWGGTKICRKRGGQGGKQAASSDKQVRKVGGRVWVRGSLCRIDDQREAASKPTSICCLGGAMAKHRSRAPRPPPQ